MRWIVTGAAGLVGARLVRALLALDDVEQVVAIDDLSAGRWERLGPALADRRLDRIRARVEDLDLLAPRFAGVSVACHLASPVGVARVAARPRQVSRSILAAGRQVLRLALRRGVRTLVVTTSEVYGFGRGGVFREEDVARRIEGTAPRLAYARAKLALDVEARAAARAGAPILVVRPFNVVAADQDLEGGHVFPAFVRAARRGTPLLLHGGGAQRRSFLWAEHAARALAALGVARRFADGWPFDATNLAAPGSLSVRELAERVRRAFGSRSSLVAVAPPPSRGEVEIGRREADTTRLAALVGVPPADSLERALAEAVARAPASAAG